MPLKTGDRVGPYEIKSPLGEGAMGVVFRAVDARLQREVAIKALPDHFAGDPERLARFLREAQVLASLNHPNIAQIYGLEAFNETQCIVMELVEGQTLQERLDRGPLALDEALPIIGQIAEALETAHEKGIVHRDLKPANIKIGRRGEVKVLDFGLAKAFATDAGNAILSNTPTLLPGETKAGVILGTAAYMAPEQVRGHEVDKRADIWAFGVVVYEMATGARPFKGDDFADTLAAVVRDQPNCVAAPPNLQRLIKKCLEKDPRKRLRDVGDWRLLVDDAPHPPQMRSSSSKLPWTAAAALAVALVAVLIWMRASPTPSSTSRLVIPLSAGQALTDFPAISPDGQMVAYAARAGSGESRLFLRSLNSFEAREVPGSGGAEEPFFSPDGRWIAFFGQGQLQKAALAGGLPVKLAGAPFPFGGMWNEDDSIIYVPDEVSGLMRINAAGGAAESLTKPDGDANGFSHTWPQPLPRGRSILFSIKGRNVKGVAVLSLDSRQWQLVLPGAMGAIFLPSRTSPVSSSGWLVSSDESAGIRLAPFDAAHPAPTVANTPVLTDVYSKSGSRRSWLTVSTNGTAAFVSGNLARRSLVRVDRDGKMQTVSTELAGYSQSILSPDGSKALELIGADLWIYDLSTGARRRLTSYGDSGVGASSPMWNRDGSRILFASNEGVDVDIYSQPADGSHPPEILLKRPNNQYPTSIAPDGTLLFGEAYPDMGEDLMTLSPDGKVSPFRVTAQFTEVNGEFSPDGHWVAYQSDESGRPEIYVEAYPAGGKRIAVSTEGGTIPMWSRDGKELFFIGDSVMTAPVKPDGSFGAIRKLFDRSPFNFFWHSYDPSPDGKWFLMIHSEQSPRQVNVIQNWVTEFEQLSQPK